MMGSYQKARRTKSTQTWLGEASGIPTPHTLITKDHLSPVTMAGTRGVPATRRLVVRPGAPGMLLALGGLSAYSDQLDRRTA